MPSPMIHLLVAYQINPIEPDLFWVGNIAPDFTDDRRLKDQMHFRNTPNRMAVLKQLGSKINNNHPFARGWLLHLFVDTCWDEIMIPAFRQKHLIQDWFVKYREETTLASFYLYHHLDWADQIWNQILNADLSSNPQKFEVFQSEVERYRDTVYKRHSRGKKDSISLEYTEDLLLDFSLDTANKYKEFMQHL